MQNQVITMLKNNYCSFESEKDLQKAGLSLADYDMLKYIIKDLICYKKAMFYQSTIKRYFEKLSIKVQEENGFYIIAL